MAKVIPVVTLNAANAGANAADFNQRADDLDKIYTDPRPQVVMTLLARYHAQYLYVGPLEQAKYPTANLHRFSSFMQIVYSADGVTIYKDADGAGLNATLYHRL